MKQNIYRNKTNKTIGGVASGLSEYFNIDVSIVRVVFIILALLNGIGLVVYIAFWIILPEKQQMDNFNSETEDDYSEQKLKMEDTKNDNTKYITGILLIIIGTLFFIERIFDTVHFFDMIPILMILIGIFILSGYFNKKVVQ